MSGENRECKKQSSQTGLKPQSSGWQRWLMRSTNWLDTGQAVPEIEKKKHDDFQDVNEEMCQKQTPIVISGIPHLKSILVAQIHYSVVVNLIKNWTCTDGALDLPWVKYIVWIRCKQLTNMSPFSCEHTEFGFELIFSGMALEADHWFDINHV